MPTTTPDIEPAKISCYEMVTLNQVNTWRPILMQAFFGMSKSDDNRTFTIDSDGAFHYANYSLLQNGQPDIQTKTKKEAQRLAGVFIETAMKKTAELQKRMLKDDKDILQLFQYSKLNEVYSVTGTKNQTDGSTTDYTDHWAISYNFELKPSNEEEATTVEGASILIKIKNKTLVAMDYNWRVLTQKTNEERLPLINITQPQFVNEQIS